MRNLIFIVLGLCLLGFVLNGCASGPSYSAKEHLAFAGTGNAVVIGRFPETAGMPVEVLLCPDTSFYREAGSAMALVDPQYARLVRKSQVGADRSFRIEGVPAGNYVLEYKGKGVCLQDPPSRGGITSDSFLAYLSSGPGGAPVTVRGPGGVSNTYTQAELATPQAKRVRKTDTKAHTAVVITSATAQVSAKCEMNVLSLEEQLYTATMENDSAWLASLLSAGVKADPVGKVEFTPLQTASGMGHGKIVKLLLENSATVNAKDPGGQTSLHWAAATGKADIVEMLMHAGADPRIGKDDGMTPLHVAAGSGHAQVVKAILVERSYVNNTDNFGQTAAHWAAGKGQVESLKILLDCGADINAKKKTGHTPLHMAISGGQIEAVKILLDRGADVNAKTNAGEMPLAMALRLGKTDIAELLKAQGAQAEAP